MLFAAVVPAVRESCARMLAMASDDGARMPWLIQFAQL